MFFLGSNPGRFLEHLNLELVLKSGSILWVWKSLFFLVGGAIFFLIFFCTCFENSDSKNTLDFSASKSALYFGVDFALFWFMSFCEWFYAYLSVKPPQNTYKSGHFVPI